MEEAEDPEVSTAHRRSRYSAEPASFATAFSHSDDRSRVSSSASSTAGPAGTARSSSTANLSGTARPPTRTQSGARHYTPPSPSPNRGPGATMSMEQTSIVSTFPLTIAAPQSTPVEYARSTTRSPRITQSLSYRSVTSSAAPNATRGSPRDPIAAYQSAITEYQQALRSQVSLRSQQLSEHAEELTFLHTRSDAALAEYANEVRAAQSRTNRALQDNQQMLQDIDRTITESRASLGLPPLFAATDRPQNTMSAPPHMESVVPPPSIHAYVSSLNARTLPDSSQESGDSHSHNTILSRGATESLEQYDQRIGRAARQQSRVVQALQPSLGSLAHGVLNSTTNVSAHGNATLRANQVEQSTMIENPTTYQSAHGQDPYANYRATYHQILNEQNAHAHRQADKFEHEA